MDSLLYEAARVVRECFPGRADRVVAELEARWLARSQKFVAICPTDSMRLKFGVVYEPTTHDLVALLVSATPATAGPSPGVVGGRFSVSSAPGDSTGADARQPGRGELLSDVARALRSLEPGRAEKLLADIERRCAEDLLSFEGVVCPGCRSRLRVERTYGPAGWVAVAAIL